MLEEMCGVERMPNKLCSTLNECQIKTVLASKGCSMPNESQDFFGGERMPNQFCLALDCFFGVGRIPNKQKRIQTIPRSYISMMTVCICGSCARAIKKHAIPRHASFIRSNIRYQNQTKPQATPNAKHHRNNINSGRTLTCAC